MVKPTRYIVTHDSLGVPRDEIELLTYKLCHSYFNFAGGISVPAPLQYARKLAKLVGERGGKAEAAFARDGTQITSGSSSNEPVSVHAKFDELPGLYFL